MSPHVPKRTIQTGSKPAEGFVLPVVLAVGLITILLGAMMIERSSQNRITAIAQKANTRSSAAAEYGVAQLQALLNRYSRLATSSPLSTWAAISDIELDPCSITPDDIARIRSYGNQEWSNVSTNPSDGQFKLISYEYKPDLGTGTLVVEGQINPDDAITRAITQLKVDFEITRAPKVGNAPGLWIEQPQAAAIDGSVQLLASFRDPTCPGDSAHAALVQKLKMQIQSPYGYQSAPGIAFPDLPPEGSSSSLVTSATTPVEAVDNDRASVTSPKVSSGQSISLTKPADSRRLGTGSDTVVLDLKEGLTITGGGKILLTSGSKLIIYAHGPVTLAGTETNPAIEQEGIPSAARVQIYVYPPEKASEPPYPVLLSGVEKPLYLSLFAPASKVTTSAQVQGSIWAKSLEAIGSAVIKEDPISLSDLNLNWPPRISPITTWQRQENS
jgi:hypothetical protein